MSFCDLHVHSTKSDAKLSVAEIICQAEKANISVLGLTDHDTTADLTDYRLQTSVALVQGSEISCLYQDSFGKKNVLHILAWGFNPHRTKIQDIFRKNNNLDSARRQKVEATLDKLMAHNIDLGPYDQLIAKHPDKKYLSSFHLAEEAVRRGYATSSNEFLDKWIGQYGQRLAYVDQVLPFVTLEEAIVAIRDGDGLCGLAHPFYYRLSAAEMNHLVARFKYLAGDSGAIEALYGPYTNEQRTYLCELAKRHRLMVSAGSDTHFWDPKDRLENHRFEKNEILRPLLEALNIERNDYVY